ncbi:uncharacterized protein LOC106673345 isoform X2 [Cimex lectularius]|uniref:Uncharacterized protein n=1 Tax=Cimex lectularius TaxID=79782 RepID=A0A8I6S873_CIMLE|nr:uncharacterized protein LOC106673345 isoform X2 [Cimex lectularius]
MPKETETRQPADGDEEFQPLDFVEEGNEQTWLICVDGEVEKLYDITEFLDLTNLNCKFRSPNEQGEGASKAIMRQHPKQRHLAKPDDASYLKERAIRSRNLMFKENRGVMNLNADSPIFINTAQIEPTLYFQNLSNPNKTTPLSTSGSNIKRLGPLYDSLIEKCDRSLLDEMEIPNKSNTSLLSSSPLSSMNKLIESDDIINTNAESAADRKINTKTFTRPKKPQAKQNQPGRKNIVDELAQKYSVAYLNNTDINSPDLDSPLDGEGKELTFQLNSTKLPEDLDNAQSSEVNKTWEIIKQDINSTSPTISPKVCTEEVNKADSMNETFLQNEKAVNESFSSDVRSIKCINKTFDKNGRLDEKSIAVENNKIIDTEIKKTGESPGHVTNECNNDEDNILNRTFVTNSKETTPSPEFHPRLMSTPKINDIKTRSKIQPPRKKCLHMPRNIYGMSTESLPGPSSSLASAKAEGSRLPVPKRRSSRIPMISKIPTPFQR